MNQHHVQFVGYRIIITNVALGFFSVAPKVTTVLFQMSVVLISWQYLKEIFACKGFNRHLVNTW